MQYRTVPKTGDQLSTLGFGCMRLPSGRLGRVNIQESHRLIHEAIDLGVNYFDTAWFYHAGRSESVLGEAIQGHHREKIYLATKLPQHLIHTREQMDRTLNQQLDGLKTETIDYYLIHALPTLARWEELERLGIREFIESAKQAGKIRHVGFSFHGNSVEFLKLVDVYPWDVCLVQYNYLDTHTQGGTTGIQYASSQDIGVLVMEPLRGGLLANQLPAKAKALLAAHSSQRSPAAWGLRWLWDQKEITMVLSGLNQSDHLREDVAVAEVTTPGVMSSEEKDLIEQVKEIFEKRIKVPCTACGYCMPCPEGVNIPGCFMHYNSGHLLHKRLYARGTYLAMHDLFPATQPTLASQCTNCGRCEELCPQHIEIRKELENVKREFEGRWTTPVMKWLVRRMM
ncbi:MAG: aldo/keto reductase, partial [Planctomycetia bacterium]